MKPQEVTDALKLTQLKDKIWFVVPSCATTGEGLLEGLVRPHSFLIFWCMLTIFATGMAIEQRQVTTSGFPRQEIDDHDLTASYPPPLLQSRRICEGEKRTPRPPTSRHEPFPSSMFFSSVYFTADAALRYLSLSISNITAAIPYFFLHHTLPLLRAFYMLRQAGCDGGS